MFWCLIASWFHLIVFSNIWNSWAGIYVGGSKVVHFTQPNIVSGAPSLFFAPFNWSSASRCTNVALGINVSASSTMCQLQVKMFQLRAQMCQLQPQTCLQPVLFLTVDFNKRKVGLSSFAWIISWIVEHCIVLIMESASQFSFVESRRHMHHCTIWSSRGNIHRAMYLLQNGFGNYAL